MSAVLSGLTPNAEHGVHIHEYGDLTEGCSSLCSHFNPTKSVHGGRNSEERHLGDLGNIEADSKGNCKTQIYDKYLQLRGYKYNIIGRSIVIHDKESSLNYLLDIVVYLLNY